MHNDPTNPNHYRRGTMECIDFIELHDAGFLIGNAIKYIVRMGYKGPAKEDWGKALWYMKRYGAIDRDYEDIPALLEGVHFGQEQWPGRILTDNFPLDPDDPMFGAKAYLLLFLVHYC